MSKLNTGWKRWDMYLSKFVNKKINCLDIGSFTGDSTCWMLNNLCQNPYSRVYSVDTWEGSPEYNKAIEFKTIEEKFDENVKKTGQGDKNVKMKMLSVKALLKLKEFGLVIFDFIFIDASHEAKDVLSDAILSWDLLNEEGVLIFDDYEWKLLNEEYFRPKIAIDSFVAIYKNQIEVLYVGYQYIIKKISILQTQKPELSDNYKLLDKLQYFKFYNNQMIIDKDNNEEIKFKLDIVKEDEKHDKMINDIENLIKLYEKEDYLDYFKYSHKYKNISDILLQNTKLNLEEIQVISIYKILFKYIINNTNIYINRYKVSKKELEFIKDYLKLDDFYYTLSNDLTINETIYNNIIKINKKFDIIFFGLLKFNDENKKYQKIYHLFNLVSALNIQKINGSIIHLIEYHTTLITMNQIIFIFKKYYKCIRIITKYTKQYSRHYYIIFEDFIGINDNELNNINKLILNIMTNYNNDNYINSIIKNNYSNELFNEFYNNKLLNTYTYLNLLYDIYKFKDDKITNRMKQILFKKSLTNIIDYIS
jgi:predicted O-methyltransferase YrrM